MKEKLVAGLTPALRQMFRVFEQHGPMTAEGLRDPLPLEGCADWKGRREGGGRTTAIRTLCEKGLLYVSGENGSRHSRVYSVTPDDKIDAVAKAFSRQNPKRKRDMTGARAAVADYKKQEKEAGPTARRDVIEGRRQMVQLGMVARRLVPMAYWSEKNFPDDEKEYVYEQAILTLDSIQRLVLSLDANRTGKQLTERVRALRAKGDSVYELGNPEEAKLFWDKAQELEDRGPDGSVA